MQSSPLDVEDQVLYAKLVLYGIRAPTIDPFRAWKPTTLCHKEPARGLEGALDARAGSLRGLVEQHYEALDQ